MNVTEIKHGAILSYLLIIANSFYGLFFTPFLITCLGESEYGVYKLIGSFIGALAILDLGIGSTMFRYIAKFNSEHDKDGINNFTAMGIIEASVLTIVIIIVSCRMYYYVDSLFSNSLTLIELNKAKELFFLFVIVLVLSVFEKVFFGVISASERFTFANSTRLFHVVLKIILVYLILSKFTDSAFLLYIDIIITLIILLFEYLFVIKKIGISIKLNKWDMKLFMSSSKYTLLMFIQSIVAQFNGNLDNMVIGAYVGAATVAVYSVGLQLYNMFEQFAIAFSDLMLPTISQQISKGENNTCLEDTVIKIGRLEFSILGGVLGGFIIIGREFIELWLGPDFLVAWIVGLILMVPTTIPLIQNVCLSILRVQNKLMFRTIMVTLMAIFNFFITVFGVKLYGPLAACIGTAISLIIANVIAMNIYYVKIIKLDILRIFRHVMSKIWVCCIVSSLFLYLVNSVIYGTWLTWMFKFCVFIIIYLGLLFVYGFNKNEKKVIFGKFVNLTRES